MLSTFSSGAPTLPSANGQHPLVNAQYFLPSGIYTIRNAARLDAGVVHNAGPGRPIFLYESRSNCSEWHVERHSDHESLYTMRNVGSDAHIRAQGEDIGMGWYNELNLLRDDAVLFRLVHSSRDTKTFEVRWAGNMGQAWTALYDDDDVHRLPRIGLRDVQPGDLAQYWIFEI
ncbi:hypothetical protein EXIGLDRAFT_758976 [Exidia glandulosa HHB12029]|uniref:Ricin B lectin domain-containing protein n=1 Tax=Exidia glandulosa HHB12029 TaxID=1314781 RepID=A0A165QHQ2_EXIGL|nr:hypothetical protein EXIGLDRAFT_758976 [Exidia glandulosa HHB12029]